MKVTVTYHDTDSLTVEEVVRQATRNYGRSVDVEVTPDSSIAYDYIYFGIQQLITHEQLSLLYDRGVSYPHEVQKLRDSAIARVAEIIDQVLVDTEAKVE